MKCVLTLNAGKNRITFLSKGTNEFIPFILHQVTLCKEDVDRLQVISEIVDE